MDKYCSKQLLEFSFVSIHVHVVRNDLFIILNLIIDIINDILNQWYLFCALLVWKNTDTISNQFYVSALNNWKFVFNYILVYWILNDKLYDKYILLWGKTW